MRRRCLKTENQSFVIPTEPIILVMAGTDGWTEKYPVGNGVEITMFADETLSSQSNWLAVRTYDTNDELVGEESWIKNKIITPEDASYFDFSVAFKNNTILKYVRVIWEA